MGMFGTFCAGSGGVDQKREMSGPAGFFIDQNAKGPDAAMQHAGNGFFQGYNVFFFHLR